MDAITLIQQCAPAIEQGLAHRLLKRESAFNPYAIGLDGKAVLRSQPKSMEEAVRKAQELVRGGYSFSVGISQVHISNIKNFGLTWEQAFDSCTNLQYGQKILKHFHNTALKAGWTGDDAVFAALRGYNSGNIYASVSNNYAAEIMGNGRGINISNPLRHTQLQKKSEGNKGKNIDPLANYLMTVGVPENQIFNPIHMENSGL